MWGHARGRPTGSPLPGTRSVVSAIGTRSVVGVVGARGVVGAIGTRSVVCVGRRRGVMGVDGESAAGSTRRRAEIDPASWETDPRRIGSLGRLWIAADRVALPEP
ncbi:hypothetical protein MYXO_03176 [Myxococcaceae bacterium]|jgi:hypothetical protein|nr:hypothetical protein MYXO_03176 [Myxococcaceae bacterium]